MKYCKPHNFFHAEDICPHCADRVVGEAGRLPYRVTDPQIHPRCHRCWNLSPVCRCDGSIGMPDPDPVLTIGK